MRNGNLGKNILMKLLMEHEEILYDFLQCTNVKKFAGVRKEDVCFADCEVVEYLPDDCYNFRFKVQCNEKKTQHHVYVSIIESNTLMENDIADCSLKSSFKIVDQHVWDEWTSDKDGIKIRELWCTMNMAYPAIFDDLMDVSSSTKNIKN